MLHKPSKSNGKIRKALIAEYVAKSREHEQDINVPLWARTVMYSNIDGNPHLYTQEKGRPEVPKIVQRYRVSMIKGFLNSTLIAMSKAGVASEPLTEELLNDCARVRYTFLKVLNADREHPVYDSLQLERVMILALHHRDRTDELVRLVREHSTCDVGFLEKSLQEPPASGLSYDLL